MKVLLTSDVEKLGWLGDIVDVADGFARNYLLRAGLAQQATKENIRAIAAEKERRAQHRRMERTRLEKLAEQVQWAEAVIAAAANEQGHLFGSVGRHAVAENLRTQGFDVPDEVVRLDENIKEVGTHEVALEFAADLTATVKVVVVPEGADIEQFKAAEQAASGGQGDEHQDQPKAQKTEPGE